MNNLNPPKAVNGMNHRQRMLAAIRHQEPDRVPIDAICIENTAAIGQVLHIPENAVLQHLDLDGRIIAAVNYAGPLPRRNGKVLSPWGTETEDDYGTSHFYPLAAATTIAEVERYPWPDPALFDFAELQNQLRDWTGACALRGPYWVSAPLFCTTCNLMGMEAALCSMLDKPAVFEACVEQVFRFSIGYLEHFVRTVGPKLDILYLADDFASQQGLMMAPVWWRKFFKPRYEQLFAMGRRLGLPIWFHSCGNITAVLPDLIDIGMNVWETVQLHTLPLSAVELKRRYGRDLTFFGGINTQMLPFKDPAQVADEVRRCIDALGPGGGYICGPDHHIKPDVPVANVIALFESARNYRKT